jgi:hypothetical protein
VDNQQAFKLWFMDPWMQTKQYFIEEHHLHYWNYFARVVVVDYLNQQEDYYLPLDWFDWLNLVYLLDFGY